MLVGIVGTFDYCTGKFGLCEHVSVMPCIWYRFVTGRPQGTWTCGDVSTEPCSQMVTQSTVGNSHRRLDFLGPLVDLSIDRKISTRQ